MLHPILQLKVHNLLTWDVRGRGQKCARCPTEERHQQNMTDKGPYRCSSSSDSAGQEQRHCSRRRLSTPAALCCTEQWTSEPSGASNKTKNSTALAQHDHEVDNPLTTSDKSSGDMTGEWIPVHCSVKTESRPWTHTQHTEYSSFKFSNRCLSFSCMRPIECKLACVNYSRIGSNILTVCCKWQRATVTNRPRSFKWISKETFSLKT